MEEQEGGTFTGSYKVVPQAVQRLVSMNKFHVWCRACQFVVGWVFMPPVTLRR